MTLRQRVHLELADGTELEAVYDGRDLRAWETRTKQSSLVGPMSLNMLTFLGWSAAKRDGSINGQFERYEAFEAQCVDVQGRPLVPPAEEAPNPPQDSDTPSDP